MSADHASLFNGKRVLITGGLGFIGSSLAIKLARAGAKVLITDAMIEEYGGNHFNIEPVRSRVVVKYHDIRDQDAMDRLVGDQDYVFLCAGQVSHVMSLDNPFPDIDINIRGTATVMEALRKHNDQAIVVKMGSRGQYGKVDRLPVSEKVRSEPHGIYEISLLAAEQLILSYYRNHGIRCVPLRLTNTYGPRAQMKHDRYGVANWFIRLAIDGMVIPVFGDGSIKRDFLFIDDCTEAILLAATTEAAYGEVLNVGHSNPSTFLELARVIVATMGEAKWQLQSFSPERQVQETGDYYSDITKITQLTGWKPSVGLEKGVQETLRYYQKHRDKYW
jgi:UDP-glucose 4-epimerase